MGFLRRILVLGGGFLDKVILRGVLLTVDYFLKCAGRERGRFFWRIEGSL